MEKNLYKISKEFGPLDDLFDLLQMIEKALNIEIDDSDYKVGREQLFYTFMHETIHAFITKSSPWIHDLAEDETDFVDEVVARILIDDLLEKLDLHSKVKLYYDNHIDHKTELKYYGFPLDSEEYFLLEKEWSKRFSENYQINAFCEYVLDYYRSNEKIKRPESFSY